jgi:hypothetical protein
VILPCALPGMKRGEASNDRSGSHVFLDRASNKLDSRAGVLRGGKHTLNVACVEEGDAPVADATKKTQAVKERHNPRLHDFTTCGEDTPAKRAKTVNSWHGGCPQGISQPPPQPNEQAVWNHLILYPRKF